MGNGEIKSKEMGTSNRRGAIYVVIDISKKKAGDYFDDVNTSDNYYLKLANRSALSLKKHMPDLPITLFTNLKLNAVYPIDNIIAVPEPVEDMWVSKFKCLLLSPYDQTVHMDADTYVCDKFDEVFKSLDKYDIASTMSVSWNTRSVSSVPDCFPELAFGVFWWRKNERVNKFFNKTIELLQHRTGGCDEPFVRIALYNSDDVRFYVLPWEYNCLYTHPAYLYGKVKIMHGHTKDIEADTDTINTKIYEDFPPWKRLITGTKVILFKKLRQKIMKVEKELDYKGLGDGTSRA
jgi:hypothetical protein